MEGSSKMTPLHRVVGKQEAGQILESGETEGSITGPELTVGGEGMKGFYDKMLPNQVKKYMKKLDKNHPGVEVMTVAGVPVRREVTPEHLEEIRDPETMLQGGPDATEMHFLEEPSSEGEAQVIRALDSDEGLLSSQDFYYDGELPGYHIVETVNTHEKYWVVNRNLGDAIHPEFIAGPGTPGEGLNTDAMATKEETEAFIQEEKERFDRDAGLASEWGDTQEELHWFDQLEAVLPSLMENIRGDLNRDELQAAISGTFSESYRIPLVEFADLAAAIRNPDSELRMEQTELEIERIRDQYADQVARRRQLAREITDKALAYRETAPTDPDPSEWTFNLHGETNKLADFVWNPYMHPDGPGPAAYEGLNEWAAYYAPDRHALPPDWRLENTTSTWGAVYESPEVDQVEGVREELITDVQDRNLAEEAANVHWNNTRGLLNIEGSVDAPQLGVQVTEAVKAKVRQGQTFYAIEEDRSLPVSLEEAGRPGGEDLTYAPVSNEASVAASRERIEANPDAAMRWVLEQYDRDAGTSETTATARGLISHYQNEAGKRTGRDRDEFYQKSIDIATRASQRLTNAGQEVQAASIISRLSPEGVQLMASKKVAQINEVIPARKSGKEFTPEMAAKFVQLGEQAQKWGILTDQARRMAAITQKINKGEALTGADMQTLKGFVGQVREILGETMVPKGKPRQPGEKKARKKGGPKGWDRILTKLLSGKESSARGRLKESGWLKAFWTSKDKMPPEILADFADVGASLMHRLGHTRYADWSAGMLEDMGEQAQPYLRDIYKASRAMLKTESSSARRVATQANRIQDLVDLWEESSDYLTAELDEHTSHTIADMVEEIKTLSGDAQIEKAQEVQHALNMLEDPSLLRQIATGQTISHLLNPKTNIRNIIGNELFFRLERLNKYLATPVDWTRSKLTGSDRTVTFRKGNQGGYWKALMKGMKFGWEGRTPGNLATQFDLEMKGPSFRGEYNPLTYMEKAMGALLRGFDYAAYSRAKAQVLGEMAILTALNKGHQPTQVYVDNFVQTADERALAISDEYGRYVTFQDENILSQSFSGFKKLLNAHQDFGLGDLVLKYPKTPANLLARSIEYSPIGILRSMYILAEPTWKNVEKNPREATLALSRAMVGSGIMAVGVKLVLAGVLTGEEDEDWDVNTFRSEQTGERQYQVNLSAIRRWVFSGFTDAALKKREGDMLYSYDWMQPIAISLGIGAQIGQGIREEKISTQNILRTIPGALATGTETIFEQPLLKGIRELFGGKKVLDSVGKIIVGMPSSFTPTFLNQLRQYTGDNKARITYDPNPLQKALNRAVYKLPYFYKALPMTFKMLGVDSPRETYQSGNNTLFNVFFNPGFVAEYKVNEQALALISPYDEELRKRQFPKRPYTGGYRMVFSSKSFRNRFKVAKLTARLEPEDISPLQRVAAGFATKEIAKQTRKALTKMSPKEQEEWLAKGVNKAHAKARKWFLDNMAQKYIDMENQ